MMAEASIPPQHFEIPIILKATVIRGFQRGSKELGIPTANLDMSELGIQGETLRTGIYYGCAELKGSLHTAVVSVGWNPFYKNEKKTVEAHLLDELPDFYGDVIKVALFGYIRDEKFFNTVDELIACIHEDISYTKQYMLERNLPNTAIFEVYP